jgi:cellulose synthase/poly-beta-1,6-N-acetylglucosamine synthase-like glycosyltransferase
LLKGVVSLVDSFRFRKKLVEALKEKYNLYLPTVCVIVPCKGVDSGFEENIRSISNQNYPNFSMVFVTESSDDPAHSFLESIISKSNKPEMMSLVCAGHSRTSAQKIHNLLEGLNHVRRDAEVLVFADSDIRVHETWLQNLVAPLQNQNIGATTGYRWYVPLPGNFWSAVRSVWNMTSANLLFSPKYTFAWGGSTAIRKTTFAELQITRKWRNGLSDDMILTNAVKAAEYSIKFVPQSLVASFEKTSFSALLEWSARQLTMIRLYDRRLWKWAAYPQWIFSLIFLLGLILISYALLSGSAVPTAAWLMISDLPLGAVINGVRFSSFLKALPHHHAQMRRFWWAYLSLHLVSSAVMSWALLRSRKPKQIMWRGIRYEVRSTEETVVLDY